jgi:hypothetical protein
MPQRRSTQARCCFKKIIISCQILLIFHITLSVRPERVEGFRTAEYKKHGNKRNNFVFVFFSRNFLILIFNPSTRSGRMAYGRIFA